MPDGILPLPASVGTGFLRLLAPEPGLKLTIHQCSLARELTLRRVADDTQPETLLISFYAFGPAPKAGFLPPLRGATAGGRGLPAKNPLCLLPLPASKT